MNGLELLVALHKPNARLGPGSDEHTRLAASLAGLRGRSNLRVADLGCGTGASTLVLAREIDAHIVAVDIFGVSLDEPARRAQEAGVADRMTTMERSSDFERM